VRAACIAIALVACGSGDDRASPPETRGSAAPAPAPAPAPVPAPVAPAGWGGCDLALGGAFDDRESIHAAQRDAARSSRWADDDPAQPALAGNCMGKTIRVSFVAAPNVTVPFGAKTYTLKRGRGDLVVLARARDKQLADVSGTIDVTAFDSAHVAGTVDLAGTAGGARVTITGRFDFPCRGWRGCAR
jgi:hypothetical protein